MMEIELFTLIGIALFWAVIAIIIGYLRRKFSGSRPSSIAHHAPDTAPARTELRPNVYRPLVSPGSPDPNSVRVDPSVNAHSPSTLSRPPDSGSVRTKRDQNVYRPSTLFHSDVQHKIQFRSDGVNAGLATDQDIKDLVDALTGAPLQTKSGLYQCRRCKVFYQAHSYEVIQSENSGRCVACLHAQIESVTGRQQQRGRNADVDVITLEDYRRYVGRVITFEGEVCQVRSSQRGTDYAVMFEDKAWARGFKMVVFQGDVNRIGGARYLSGLRDRRVRVRGLLVCHERFGYEIIVSDRAMILSVQ